MNVDEDNPCDCGNGHVGEKINCFEQESSFKFSSYEKKWVVTKENLEQVMDEYDKEGLKQGNKLPFPFYRKIRDMAFCPMYLFDDSIKEAFEYYNACDGLHVSTPDEYDASLALWVHICRVCDVEKNEWLPIKQAEMSKKWQKKTKSY